MNAKRVNAAAGVLHAAQVRGRVTAAGLAADLEAAGLLQSPATAAETERLRARVAELEAERHATNSALAEVTEALRAAEGRADGLAVGRPAVLEPDGCRHCGIPERGHARQWTRAAGWHAWVEPSDGQRLERMRARRAARTEAGYL
ncbi:hypothetical protein ACMA1D_02180 [Streptomyces sp. 796.1]|uniref:hypothetical protein n=1 Tax=Streptomyces sp. 796.1 TaxID=3163029 RepID=UPI0039C96A9B